MKKITIEASEAQVKVIKEALELYARLGLGQMEYVADHIIDNNDLNMARADSIRGLVMAVKEVLGHPANGSYSIRHENVAPKYKDAYAMWQAVARASQDEFPIPEGEVSCIHDGEGSVVIQDLPNR